MQPRPRRRHERVAYSCLGYSLRLMLFLLLVLVVLVRLFIGPYSQAEHDCKKEIDEVTMKYERICTDLQYRECYDWKRLIDSGVVRCASMRVVYEMGPCSFGLCELSWNLSSVILSLVLLVLIVLIFLWIASTVGSVFALLSRTLRATELPLTDDADAHERHQAYLSRMQRTPANYYEPVQQHQWPQQLSSPPLPPPPLAPGYIAPGTTVYMITSQNELRNRQLPPLLPPATEYQYES